MEVKYQNEISRADLKNLIEFMKEFGVGKALVVSKDIEDEIRVDNKTIEILPAWRLSLQPSFL